MPGEQQHYVPKFLLRNFTRGKKPQIYVYDKSNDHEFKTHIKNIAAESNFYEIELEDSVLTLEPSLSDLETNASAIIKKLLRRKAVELDEKELAILAVFLAVQFVRTKEHRLRFDQMGQMLRENFGEWPEPNASENKLFGFRSVLRAKDFVPHFLNKTWLLLETTLRHPFFISDNPVTLYNQVDLGPRGNLGLAVRGIQIYLPVSSTMCLALLCPAITAEFQEHFEVIKAWRTRVPGLGSIPMRHPEIESGIFEGIKRGVSIKITESMATMINSLQVMYSSRFVYCETKSFELVKEMIAISAGHRESLKPTAN